MADDILWHVGGNNPMSGDYHGKEDVMAMMGRLAAEYDGTFKVHFHDILTNGTHGVALVNISATKNGKSADGRAVHIWHDNADAKTTEFWTIGETQAEFDALWD